MLQDIRKSSQGTAAKVIVGLIIVVFALFGAESIVGGLSGEPEVATVNGEEILESQFLRAVEGKRRQILSQMGEKADPDLIDEGLLRSSVLEGMINEKILVQDADEKGLFVSDMAVDNYIRNIEQFQIDGQFSNEKMQTLLRNAGLTLKDYRDSLKSQFVLGQSRSGLIASAFVSDVEQNEILALDRQTRSFGMATVFKRDYLDDIAVSEEEIAERYEANKEAYKKPENVNVSYLLLDRATLQERIQVNEKELETLYESEKNQYQGEEQRAASHILIKISDERNEAAALEQITAIQQRLANGEKFEDLAKELSEDEGSAQNGGDLGLSGRGVYVSDFETALFALTNGQISAPVKTEFGYHLIRLDRIDTSDIPSYDEMHSMLESRLAKQKIDQLYASLSEQLADITYSSPDLKEAADALDLSVQTLAGVSARTDHSLFSSKKIQKVLFSNELVVDKHNSELIEVEEGKSLVFRVDAYQEETIQSLAAVKDKIRNELKAEKTAEYAAKTGETFIDRVRSGEDPQAVSDDMGLNWKVYNDVRRDNVMLEREVITKAFTLPRSMVDANEVVGFDVMDGDYALVRLLNVGSGSDQITAIEKSSIENMLGDTLGATDYQAYQQAAIDQSDIERRSRKD
jgi:peptidyl-prolyl cis-trans isomerase D